MKLRYYMRGLGIGVVVTAILLSVSFHKKSNQMTDEQIMERARELGMEEKYETSVLAETVSDNQLQEASADKQQPDKEGLHEKTVEEKQEAQKQENEKESAQNKQAQDALDRAEQAKEDAKQTAEETLQKTEGLADEASKLKVGTGSDAKEETKPDTKDMATPKPAKENTAGKNETADKLESSTDKTEDNTDKTGHKTDNLTDGTSKQDTQSKTDSKTDNPAKEVTITVNGGDGSFEVAKKLKAAGIIQDEREYDTYLCQNGYDRKITTGKHVIKKGATEEEIAKELTTKPK